MDRILIIAGKLHIGGAEKVCRDIALYADPEIYNFDYVVYGENRGEYEEILENRGFRVFHLPEPSEGHIAHIRALKALMGAGNYRCVHAHTMFNCGWAMWVAKGQGIPVRIAHAHSALGESGSFARRIYETVMGILIRRCATQLVGCSESAGLRLYGEEAWATRGRLIPNGVDPEEFAFREEGRNAVRRKLNLQGKRVLGHMGHLSPVKNQKFLLELMPRILEADGDARLLLLGEGEDRPLLEAKIRELELENQVILTGNVPDVGDYLSAMDVFLLPSLYEGMPLAVLEAMANGLPCIVSDSVTVPGTVALSLDAPRQVWVQRIFAGTRGEGKTLQTVEAAMEEIYGLYGKGTQDDQDSLFD